MTAGCTVCRFIIVPGDGQYILPPRPFSRFVFYAGAMSLGTFEETRPEGGFLRFLRFSIVRSHREAFVLCNIPKRGCMRGRLCCAGVHPRVARPPGEVELADVLFCERPSSRCALGPQRPFAVARPLSPALARRGQIIACFLVWVHGTRTTVVLESAPPKHPLWIRELERASGRRLAPLSERSE